MTVITIMIYIKRNTASSSLSTNIILQINGRWLAGGSATLSVRLNAVVIDSFYIGSAGAGSYFSANINIQNVNIVTSDVLDVVVSWPGSQAYNMQILSGSINVQNVSAAFVPINYGEAIHVNQTTPRNIYRKIL